MKKPLLFSLAFVLLIGCQAGDSADVSPNQESREPAYTSDVYGFSFDHPKDWKVWDEVHPDEKAKNVIGWVFAPDDFSAFDACMQANDRSKWQLECGALYAKSVMGIYSEGYIDYESFDEWGKSNFVDYRKRVMGQADGFSYTMQGNASIRGFHVNSPDKSTGITFLVFAERPEVNAALETMLSTFRFTGSAPQK
jgi:hypothetical protein